MTPAAPDPPAFLDGQGRRITYLRLSLTDRCNFHCSYCAPAAREGSGPLMSRGEIRRLTGVFARLGIRPQYVPMHQDQALADLAGDNPTIDAMVYVAGRGSPPVSRTRRIPSRAKTPVRRRISSRDMSGPEPSRAAGAQ